MPTREALDDAMRHPGRAVPGINRIGGGTVAQISPGRFVRAVGTTAIVYQLRQPSGRLLALRCPLGEPPDKQLAERYRVLVHATVPQQLREAPPRPLVRVHGYLPDGLALPAPDFRSTPRPMIVLDWVAGPTLAAAVERACREFDRASLTSLADAWLAAMRALTAVGFTHGDLTADNALVRTDRSITLVDYDTCSWTGGPSQAAAPPAPAYRHPSLKSGKAGLPRDDFAALVIYASLRALAQWPELRTDYGEPAETANGALLFSARDLGDPDGSPLFDALASLPNPEDRALIEILRRACHGTPDAVPPLRDVLSTTRTPPGRAANRPPAAAPAPAPPPEETDARERQRRLTRLNSLLLAGDDAGALRFWHESGLARDAAAVDELGPRIAALERRRPPERPPAPPPPAPRPTAPPSPRPTSSPSPRPPRPAPLPPAAAPSARAARAATPAPRGWPASPAAERWPTSPATEAWPTSPAAAERWLTPPAAEAWPEPPSLPPLPARPRGDDVERLEAALEAGDADTVATLWQRLRTEPRAATLAWRVNQLISLAAGAAIFRTLERRDDAATLEAVREAERFGVVLQGHVRREAREAAARLAVRDELAAALAAGDHARLAALERSGQLARLDNLPAEAMHAVAQAVEWPAVQRALATDDDAAIMAVFDPEIFAESPLPNADQWARLELAYRRTEWLHGVRVALKQRDAPALKALRQAAPPGAEERLSRVERSRMDRLVQREAAAERLAEALNDGSDAAIVEALGRIVSSGAELPQTLDWAAVGSVVHRVTLVEAIRRAAAADPPDHERLSRLISEARAAAEGGDAALAAELDFAALEASVMRAAHRGRLLDALARNDDYAIAAAAHPDPFGALATLSEQERARVSQALIAVGRRKQPVASRQ